MSLRPAPDLEHWDALLFQVHSDRCTDIAGTDQHDRIHRRIPHFLIKPGKITK
jgi:hypothetical protein